MILQYMLIANLKISIHQPNFLPFGGFWDKMSKSNIFVILDNVQYSKNSYTNRCEIKTPEGKKWLTMPVIHKFPQLIKDVELFEPEKNKMKCFSEIKRYYKTAINFREMFPKIKELINFPSNNLSEYNIHLIKSIAELLDIKTQIVLSSNYKFQGNSTELLINICKHFGADIYLSGKGGKKYQDEEMFKMAGIKVEYNDWVQPEYPQLWKEFIPNLSIIDYLMNITN